MGRHGLGQRAGSPGKSRCCLDRNGDGGGRGGDGVSGALSDSHAYNPTSDTWRTLDGSVGSREDLSAVWTGTQVLVFGGESGSQKVDLPMEVDPTLPVHLYRKE